MKRFIVLLSALFCLSFAQDIAGSWTLTGVDVNYYNFARPNVATAGQAFIDMENDANPLGTGYQFHTPLNVVDTYGLGASLPLAWLPPGYMFLDVRNGPFGEGGLAANGVNLNVTLYADGSGIIPEGSTYPDIALDPEACITTGGVLPVTDEVIYSSNLSANVTLPATDIVGKPSKNPYAGTQMGAMSLSQSVVFSFFPIDAVNDVSPWYLFFDATTPAVNPTPNADGTFSTLGVTGGFIKNSDFDGSIGDEDPLSTDQPTPELALYWHTIDGYSADTGFGDNGLSGGDEDGDGTDFDRIFGLPAISATRIDAGLAYTFGFGTDFDRLVAGDITEQLGDLVEEGCQAQVDANVATCGTIGLDNFVWGACVEQAGSDEFAAGCGLYGVAASVTQACLDANGPATAEEAAAVGSPVTCAEIGAQYDAASGGDCATAAGLASLSCTDSNGASLCCLAGAIATATSTCEEVVQAGAGGPCDAIAAATIADFTTVTTTDDYVDDPDTADFNEATRANEVYVMNPDPNFELWNQFVTFNGYMYGETINPETGAGDQSYLVDDSGWNVDFSNVYFISAVTGQACDPTGDDPYCLIPVSNGADGVPDTGDEGGRLVFKYQPTCVPVVEAMEVQTEFVEVCTNANTGNTNGDLDDDGLANIDVLDVVQIVGHITGSGLLDDNAFCRADINADGAVDVLDVVAVVQIIVAGNERAEAATSAKFTRNSDSLVMNANGVVGAVQMTLSHGNDFSIELTDNAFLSGSHTADNQTILVVVLPESGELFSSTGEYTIDEVVAATEEGYIATSTMPVSFNLSDAYPNPFNPSTSLDIELSYASNVSIVAYNVMGQMVSVLHDGNMGAGMHAITWDAADLASGMYIIKAEVANEVISKKVMLLK